MVKQVRRARPVSANKGATKALKAMIARYGAKRGRQVFFAKAEKFGKRGKSPSQKGNAVFGKGSHAVKNSKKRRKK